jgi:hypothetical protein
MLSGRCAFLGESAADTLSAILKEEPPDLSEKNKNIDPVLERVVRHCLEKNPEERFDSASDLAFALEFLSTPSGIGLDTSAQVIAPKKIARLSRRWMWAVLALTAVALIVIGRLSVRLPPPSGDAPSAWVEIGPPNRSFAFIPGPAISPDGRQIAFWAPDETGKVGLWIRSLDSPTARALAGTAAQPGAGNITISGNPPFWSPDGRSLGFFVDGKLKRIDLAGGTPLTLADATNPRGGTWNAAGVIIFVPADGKPVYRVYASGGEATPLSLPSIQEPCYPHFLPDGRHFLVASPSSGVWLAAVDASETRQLSKVESA